MTKHLLDVVLYTLLTLLIATFVTTTCMSICEVVTKNNDVQLHVKPSSHIEVTSESPNEPPNEPPSEPPSESPSKSSSESPSESVHLQRQMTVDECTRTHQSTKSNTDVPAWSSLSLSSCQDQLRLPLLVRHPVDTHPTFPS